MDLRLPREIENDACHAAVRDRLAANTRRLWPGDAAVAPVVPLSDTLGRALRTAAAAGQLCRGLEGAEARLDAERRGIVALPPAEARRQGARVSRLLFVANDGAERFYRHVARLVTIHAPRVLACIVDADSTALGEALFGSGAVAKLVLAEHKSAVAAILRALAEERAPDR